jgi:hypothetical protein
MSVTNSYFTPGRRGGYGGRHLLVAALSVMLAVLSVSWARDARAQQGDMCSRCRQMIPWLEQQKDRCQKLRQRIKELGSGSGVAYGGGGGGGPSMSDSYRKQLQLCEAELANGKKQYQTICVQGGVNRKCASGDGGGESGNTTGPGDTGASSGGNTPLDEIRESNRKRHGDALEDLEEATSETGTTTYTNAGDADAAEVVERTSTEDLEDVDDGSSWDEVQAYDERPAFERCEPGNSMSEAGQYCGREAYACSSQVQVDVGYMETERVGVLVLRHCIRRGAGGEYPHLACQRSLDQREAQGFESQAKSACEVGGRAWTGEAPEAKGYSTNTEVNWESVSQLCARTYHVRCRSTD